MTEIERLERAVLKTAMRRYKRWKKEYGELKPFGHPQSIAQKDSWLMTKACENLDKALRGPQPDGEKR